MNDRRFVSILNQVASSMEPTPLGAAPGRSETEAIQLWADFLRRCVESGVSVGDPRWRRLEVQRAGGKSSFRLPDRAAPRVEPEEDLSVGLTLLMAMLHPDDPAD
jgi:hypothetical protein